MPVETLSDVVDDLLDKLGIYGAHPEPHEEAPGAECHCRCCEEIAWTERILSAVEASMHGHFDRSGATRARGAWDPNTKGWRCRCGSHWHRVMAQCPFCGDVRPE